MTIATPTSNVIEFVEVGKQVTVTVPSGGAAVVDRIFNGLTLDATAVAASTSATFGPYFVPMTLRISASAGTASVAESTTTTSCVDLGGGGGGAAAFTDLTDAPSSYADQAFQLAFVNAAETGLDFSGNLKWEPSAGQLTFADTTGAPSRLGIGSEAHNGAASGGTTASISSVATHEAGLPTISQELYCEDRYTDPENPVYTDLIVTVTPQGLEFNLDGLLKLTGLDVVASDATATMTVNAVEYEITKAIKVKIGADTYFWPLFGPVA